MRSVVVLSLLLSLCASFLCTNFSSGVSTVNGDKCIDKLHVWTADPNGNDITRFGLEQQTEQDFVIGTYQNGKAYLCVRYSIDVFAGAPNNLHPEPIVNPEEPLAPSIATRSYSVDIAYTDTEGNTHDFAQTISFNEQTTSAEQADINPHDNQPDITKYTSGGANVVNNAAMNPPNEPLLENPDQAFADIRAFSEEKIGFLSVTVTCDTCGGIARWSGKVYFRPLLSNPNARMVGLSWEKRINNGDGTYSWQGNDSATLVGCDTFRAIAHYVHNEWLQDLTIVYDVVIFVPQGENGDIDFFPGFPINCYEDNLPATPDEILIRNVRGGGTSASIKADLNDSLGSSSSGLVHLYGD